MAYIYKITNVATGKIYVGQTTQTLTERYERHVTKSKSLETYICRAIRKYGAESFNIEALEEVESYQLNERERYWIKALNSQAPNGYNMTEGGEGGDTSKSPNYIAGMKQRDYRGSRNPNYGKLGSNSPNYGKRRTAEQKQNLHNGLKKGWDNNPARKAKLSIARSGKNNLRYGKKPPNTMRVEFEGKIYDSLAEASRIVGRSPQYVKKYGKVISEQ